MGRFPGWNEAAVIKLTGGEKEALPVRKKQHCPTKDYAGQIAAALNMLGISCEREYRFIKDRRFRFDIALPDHKIAIEFDGGVYNGGRHTRSIGFINDTKKFNLATMHGWKLLRYTTEITKELNWEFRIADEIKQLINHS
jgi:very-short-patch-repair endonuclease